MEAPSPQGGVGSSWVLATGDFNSDGTPDLVVSDGLESALEVYLSRGDGTFDTGAQIPIGENVQDLAVVDLNRDGAPDLVSVHPNTAAIVVAMNRGDGTFLPATMLPVPDYPYGIVGADFDGDGNADLVTISSDVLRLFPGLGDGGFAPPVTSATVDLAYRALAGDFNGDGKLDLAVGAYQWAPGVAIALGDGHGGFTDGGQYPAGAGSVWLTLADFNHDGVLDLATANSRESTVSVLLGVGDGTFENVATLPATDGGPTAQGITSGDFDGDGNMDIAAGSFGMDSSGNAVQSPVSVFYGYGDGGFATAVAVGSDVVPTDVVAADWNGDGRLDLAAADFSGRDPALILLNMACAP